MEERIKLFLQNGSGCGCGNGCGNGSGSGSGSGDGYGYGDGDDYGDGDGIKVYGNDKVYVIDGIDTIIRQIKGNVAKGFILCGDLTLTATYVVKDGGKYAHGRTLHEAFGALQEKLYDGSTEEERIGAFKERFKDFAEKVQAEELFRWHHILTGSCKQGREAFCRDKGIDVAHSEFTIHEFIDMTKDYYGGHVIKKLIK